MATYRILPRRSKLAIAARSSLHGIDAEAKALEGQIEMQVTDGGIDASVQPKGSLVIDVEDIVTGNRLYDGQIKSELEARKYPVIRGEVRNVEPLDKNRFRVRGDLTLHGVTRSIEGEVTLKVIDDNTVEVEGEKTIDLRDFNLTPPQILMLKVYPDVKVRARIVAQRAA